MTYDTSSPPRPVADVAKTAKSVTSKRWPRYLLYINGRWRWRPTRQMRASGFALTSFEPEISDATILRAEELNAEWDLRRRAKSGESTSEPIRPNILQGESIYVVGFNIYVKIGWTTDMSRRIEELECRLPEPLIIHATFKGTRRIETALHGKYDAYRLRGEWFRLEGHLADWIAAGCPFGGMTWSKINRS